jgi:ATP-dependent helicase/nuclease subunit A
VDLERKIRYPTMARRALETVLTRENQSEEQRILYVAMTRAREKLILVDTVFHVEKRLRDLLSVTSCPVMPEAVADGKSFGDWLLLPLLCCPESAGLRALAGVEMPVPEQTTERLLWKVALHDAQADQERPDAVEERPDHMISEKPEFNAALLEFVYPFERETELPAKLTATQLKSENEMAEGTNLCVRPLSQPRFTQSAGLTPAEAGTATHLVLQYLDFTNFDIPEQVQSLCRRHFLTEEQASAVMIPALERFLRSPLAEELRRAEHVLREYRFTVLMDASAYDAGAVSGDQILLQGTVDCCFESEDGTLTIVDFKTDRVEGARLTERAEYYRPQLEVYGMAMNRVLQKVVGRKILYFLYSGKQVEFAQTEKKFGNDLAF